MMPTSAHPSAGQPTLAAKRRRLRRRLRNFVAGIDSVYMALLRRARPDFAVTQASDLVIEGYPRSANSYLEGCFLHAFGHDLRIAQHSHVAAQVREGVRLGKPVIVVFREPVDAVASLIMRNPEIYTWSLAYREYIDFHEGVLPVADRVTLVPFAMATGDFPAVIRSLNAHCQGAPGFSPWAVPDWGAEDYAAVYREVDRLTAARIGRASTAYSPSHGGETLKRRRAEKSDLTAALRADPASAHLREQAQGLFAQMSTLAKAPVQSV